MVFKPKMDARYSENSIITHDKVEIQATNVVQPKEILDLFHHADVVAIDEVQFLIHQLSKFVILSPIKVNHLF